MDREKILITGSNGYLATHLVNGLSAKYDIIGCDIHTASKNNCAHYFECNFLEGGSIHSLVNKLILNELIPDIVINNAALDSVPFVDGKREYWSESAFENYFTVNVKAPVKLFNLIVEQWLKSGITGKVINLSSIYGKISPDPSLYRDGFIKDINYGASKAAFDNIFSQLSVIFGKRNVQIFFIELGGVYSKSHDTEFRGKYLSRLPANEFVQIDDVLSGVVYLLGLSKNGTNGTRLKIDGGYTLI